MPIWRDSLARGSALGHLMHARHCVVAYALKQLCILRCEARAGRQAGRHDTRAHYFKTDLTHGCLGHYWSRHGIHVRIEATSGARTALASCRYGDGVLTFGGMPMEPGCARGPPAGCCVPHAPASATCRHRIQSKARVCIYEHARRLCASTSMQGACVHLRACKAPVCIYEHARRLCASTSTPKCCVA
jgi:hypothetical protein